MQIRFPVEAASDRGEGGNRTLEGLQSETAREYTSGARGCPFSVHRQFRRKLHSTSFEKLVQITSFSLFIVFASCKIATTFTDVVETCGFLFFIFFNFKLSIKMRDVQSSREDLTDALLYSTWLLGDSFVPHTWQVASSKYNGCGKTRIYSHKIIHNAFRTLL